ncbi:hypothetical protein GUJ93_ZPchr0001g30331 [Zizania palustris]|uniref:PTM/DIR17-like Tudor domain-containing protein n=1 Tax=Zizania palustris TaxID=103762 RepID=A0A8J5RJV9_ZIZPA|nr:hypothetical protein GUJ93_ZPchr0001g30331 [Zizania palustris]
MEETHGMQESDTASVVKVPREPAIIINGVPDLPLDCASESQREPSNAAEPQVDHRFGEWLEGRKVRKLFGDKYYVGKVIKYDSESNWYSVVYDDGDHEDLEWHEVEEVLMPLDITIPLKTLVMDKCGLQSTVPDFRSKVSRSRKVYAIMEDSTNKELAMVPISQGSNVMGNQMMTGAVNGQQSNNVPELCPAPTSNDASGGQLVIVTARENIQACAEASGQPRKRGRPRKDATMPANTQPKKRGRPPKNRSTSGNVPSAECTTMPDNTRPKKRGRPLKNRGMSGNVPSAECTTMPANTQLKKRGRPPKNRSTSGNVPTAECTTMPANTQPKKRGRPPKNRSTSGNVESAECTPNSLVLVPVQDARAATDKQESSMGHNSVLQRNVLTAKAEKLAKAERLKRENMDVQGAPPGTQLF